LTDNTDFAGKRKFQRTMEWPTFLLTKARETMNRNRVRMALAISLLIVAGCSGEERGPILAGGREVKSWIADLHDPTPQVRRQAVLKLGNVGDTDPAVAAALSEALRDSDAIVRRDAVSAVAKLGKPTEEIMAQLRIMGDRDPDSRVGDYARRAILRFEKGR
jgi:HEAT repeats